MDEVGQEVQTRAIGPVDVLDQQENRCQARQPVEEEQHLLEHAPRSEGIGAGPHQARLPKPGQQSSEIGPTGPHKLVQLPRRQLVRQATQRLYERSERRGLAPKVDAAAFEHADPERTRARRDLPEEARLANACFPRNEEDGGLSKAHLVQCRHDSIQLAASAHERRARDPQGHERHRKAEKGWGHIDAGARAKLATMPGDRVGAIAALLRMAVTL